MKIVELNWVHEREGEVYVCLPETNRQDEYQEQKTGKDTTQNDRIDSDEYINLIQLVLSIRRGGGEKNGKGRRETEERRDG